MQLMKPYLDDGKLLFQPNQGKDVNKGIAGWKQGCDVSSRDDAQCTNVKEVSYHPKQTERTHVLKYRPQLEATGSKHRFTFSKNRVKGLLLFQATLSTSSAVSNLFEAGEFTAQGLGPYIVHSLNTGNTFSLKKRK